MWNCIIILIEHDAFTTQAHLPLPQKNVYNLAAIISGIFACTILALILWWYALRWNGLILWYTL